MGNGATLKNRYMGGKSLQKYFREDAWPPMEELLERLHISESKGFELFKAFARIDMNENGLVELDECFKYIGGNRTRFTERIFYHVDCTDEYGRKVMGLKFREFSIVLWNYCSLTPAGLARFVFEIFDIENNESLDQPEVEAIYRMLYDTTEVDSAYLAAYEFDDEDRISKSDFMNISAKTRVLIQPALDYQHRLRKCLGGQYMWDALMNYRKKNFSVHDTQADNLNDAIESIIRSHNTNKRKVITTDNILAENKQKLQFDMELAERELKLREKQLLNEKRLQEMNAEDRKMIEAWKAYNDCREFFSQEEFLLDDVWRRHELRDEMYTLYDEAVEASKEYWDWKVRKDIVTTEGTEADHEARYQDYLLTDEGKVLHQFYLLYYLFEILEEVIRTKNAKNKYYSEDKKNEKQMTIETTLEDLIKTLTGITDTSLTQKEHDKKINALKHRVFDDEIKTAKKYAKKSEWQEAERKTHKDIAAQIKVRTMTELHKRIEIEKEERKREYVRKAFDIATNFGSRITRYVMYVC